MRLLLILLCFCLLQACNSMQNSAKEITPLFPFERKIQKDQKDQKINLDLINSDITQPLFTQKAEQSFAYLALDEAIQNDDLNKILEASEALLRLSPNSQYIADAASWLLSNGHLKEAHNILENAVKVLPNDLAMHVMFSEAILLQNKNNNEAIQILQSYILRNPTQYVAYMELALAYLKMEKPKNAYDTFAKLPEKEKTPVVLYYTGFALRKLGRIAEAVKTLEKALKAMPDFMEVILELAQIEEQRKNYKVARQYYNRVLNFDVYNQDVLLRLVAISLKEGNPNRAVKIVQENLDSFNFVIGASSMLMEEGRVDLVQILFSHLSKQKNAPRELIYLQGALAYEGMKNHAKALMFLKQVTPQDKHYKNSLELKIQIYLEQEKFTETIATLQKAQKAFPDELAFISMQYQIHLYQGEYTKALPLLAKYTTLDPDDPDAAFRYAFVHVNLDMENKGFKLMEALLKKEPENPEVLNFVGYTLVERKKRLNYALGLLEKANKKSPNQYYILDSLAWAHYRLKSYEKAWGYINQAIALIDMTAPQDHSMWEHYGDIAFELKKIDEAKLGWERSLKIKNDVGIENKLKKLQSLFVK